jgi:hypothetical protein
VREIVHRKVRIHEMRFINDSFYQQSVTDYAVVTHHMNTGHVLGRNARFWT